MSELGALKITLIKPTYNCLPMHLHVIFSLDTKDPKLNINMRYPLGTDM